MLAEVGPQVGAIAVVGGRQRPLQALVDTGAEISMVADHVLAELHSSPEGVPSLPAFFQAHPRRAVSTC